MKGTLRGLLVASLACTAMLGATATTSAGYSLNEEVKAPTPALLTASQIGVIKYENPHMKYVADKDAILVMSFGTTFKDTRQKTIQATYDQIRAAHPGVKVVLAFTSHIIIDRIQANEGIKFPTPEEALEQLKREGYTNVAMTSLDIIPGMEYAYDLAVFHNYKENFKTATIATPLVYWMGQEEQRDDCIDFLKALQTQFPRTSKNEAILLMAHGTPHPANAYYSVIQNRIDEMGWKNVHLYSVEGWPRLDDIIPKLKADGVKKVTLMPIMIVAGDHANNDMAGDEEDSHKTILQNEGFKVDAYIHGLGENRAIRNLFVERANEAWDTLKN